MVFENGPSEVENDEFTFPARDVLCLQRKCKGLQRNVLPVGNPGWRNINHDCYLALDRSRRPLGVRTSDWYQNDRTDLNFQPVSFVSPSTNLCFCYFGKTVKWSDQNRTFSVDISLKSDPKVMKYRKYAMLKRAACLSHINPQTHQFWWESVQ